MKRKIISLLAVAGMGITLFSGCGGTEANTEESQDDTVTLEFAQWWEPELPDGEFRNLIDEFEAENPGIKVELISGPFASTKEQIIAGAAAGTMADIVGVDGAWVNEFAEQGYIANLSEIMKEYSYDEGQLVSQVQLDGNTYMIPVLNFVYPLFINTDIMEASGVQEIPTTRDEFHDAAKVMTNVEENVYGWALPLSMDMPNGIQNDVMSWLWASGKSMLKDGKPDVESEDMEELVTFIKNMYDEGILAPGSLTMKTPERVEEFANGRVGMMVSSMAHINVVRENNPNLNFKIAPLPVVNGYSGQNGVTYASWGIAISENTEHKEEAWKFVEFLLSKDVNSKLASMSYAFPGNKDAEPTFIQEDEAFADAYEFFKSGYLCNEFTGLPKSEELMRLYDEQLQLVLTDQIGIAEMLKNVQASWEEIIN